MEHICWRIASKTVDYFAPSGWDSLGPWPSVEQPFGLLLGLWQLRGVDHPDVAARDHGPIADRDQLRGVARRWWLLRKRPPADGGLGAEEWRAASSCPNRWFEDGQLPWDVGVLRGQ